MSDGDGLHLGVQLHAAIEALTGSLEKHTQKTLELLTRLSDAPRDVFVNFSGVAPSSGSFNLASSMQGGAGPQQGEVWVVRMIRVGGETPTTTAAGRADVYKAPLGAALIGSPNLSYWIDQAATLPLVGSYGDRQFVMRYPDKMHIIISNGTSTQQYLANAQIECYKDGGYEGVVNL